MGLSSILASFHDDTSLGGGSEILAENHILGIHGFIWRFTVLNIKNAKMECKKWYRFMFL